MKTSVLLMGAVLTLLFIIPFYFALRFAHRGKQKLKQLIIEEAKRVGLAVSKIVVFTTKALIVDTTRKKLFWCESSDGEIKLTHYIDLNDIGDTQVFVNGSLLLRDVDANKSITSVKLHLTLQKGNTTSINLPLFELPTDDPLNAHDALKSANKWCKILTSANKE